MAAATLSCYPLIFLPAQPRLNTSLIAARLAAVSCLFKYQRMPDNHEQLRLVVGWRVGGETAICGPLLQLPPPRDDLL